MRAPWWRAQTQHWYVKINGKQHRLSEEPDPDGGGCKPPPPHVEAALQKAVEEISRQKVD